jgi:hypothetical protein
VEKVTVYSVPVVPQSINEWLDFLWSEPTKENFDDAKAWLNENYEVIYQKPSADRYGDLVDVEIPVDNSRPPIIIHRVK